MKDTLCFPTHENIAFYRQKIWFNLLIFVFVYQKRTAVILTRACTTGSALRQSAVTSVIVRRSTKGITVKVRMGVSSWLSDLFVMTVVMSDLCDVSCFIAFCCFWAKPFRKNFDNSYRALITVKGNCSFCDAFAEP